VQNGTGPVHDREQRTFTGLPVIGFAVQTFNPSLSTSYAGTFYHRYISGAPTSLLVAQ
jgi:hypothetical protein